MHKTMVNNKLFRFFVQLWYCKLYFLFYSLTSNQTIWRPHVQLMHCLCVTSFLCESYPCGTHNTAGHPGQSLESRQEIYGLHRTTNSLSHTSSYLKGQAFRLSGVVNLAPWLSEKPDTRITIPHPSLTLKPLIPCYTKQKQPSLASAQKSQGMKKTTLEVFCNIANSLQWLCSVLMNISCWSTASASSSWILLKAALMYLFTLC